MNKENPQEWEDENPWLEDLQETDHQLTGIITRCVIILIIFLSAVIGYKLHPTFTPGPIIVESDSIMWLNNVFITGNVSSAVEVSGHDITISGCTFKAIEPASENITWLWFKYLYR